MPEFITTRDMLREMEQGKHFSISRIKYDRSRKKGGEIEVIEEAILYTKKKADENAAQQVGRSLTVVEEKKKELNELRSKKSNHKKWYSRNLIICQNGHPTSIIRKFHPPLVLEFNGLTVVP